jgi:methionyl aminopeptidase
MEKDVLSFYLKAGETARKAVELTRRSLKEGVSALDVVMGIESLIREEGCAPAFPVNISIDADAAHFTPVPGDDVIFRAGQVVKVDIGVHCNGYIADTAVTLEISTSTWKKLIEAAEEALTRALALIRAGTPIGMLSEVIETTIRSAGYKPVENLTGHYLGRYLIHAGGNIPNVRGAASGILREGDVIAIEPFATPGAGRIKGTRFGNIYRIREPKGEVSPDLQRVYDDLRSRFSTLPFTLRWAPKMDPGSVSQLLRKQLLMRYPVLTEERRGIVSQAEHSAIVTREGAIVYTRD